MNSIQMGSFTNCELFPPEISLFQDLRAVVLKVAAFVGKKLADEEVDRLVTLILYLSHSYSSNIGSVIFEEPSGRSSPPQSFKSPCPSLGSSLTARSTA